MKSFSLKKFALFFVAYFVLVMIIQTVIFPGDEPMQAIIFKNFVSGLIASAIFTYITRKKN